MPRAPHACRDGSHLPAPFQGSFHGFELVRRGVRFGSMLALGCLVSDTVARPNDFYLPGAGPRKRNLFFTLRQLVAQQRPTPAGLFTECGRMLLVMVTGMRGTNASLLCMGDTSFIRACSSVIGRFLNSLDGVRIIPGLLSLVGLLLAARAQGALYQPRVGCIAARGDPA